MLQFNPGAIGVLSAAFQPNLLFNFVPFPPLPLTPLLLIDWGPLVAANTDNTPPPFAIFGRRFYLEAMPRGSTGRAGLSPVLSPRRRTQHFLRMIEARHIRTTTSSPMIYHWSSLRQRLIEWSW